MARPKKVQPNRADGRHEVKITVGKKMDGTLIRKSFFSTVSKADARRQAEEYKTNQAVALSNGTVFVQKGANFAEWARTWLTTYKKPHVDENTYRLAYEVNVEKHLIPYFGNADLRTIQPVNIQEFYSTKKHLSESVLSKINMCLVGIFDSAIENDLCFKNPAKSKTVNISSEQEKKKKRVLTDAEIRTVLTRCELPEIIVLLSTGMRRGELCGLMWTDIDFDAGVIRINRSIADVKGGGVKTNAPKWKSYRPIPIDNPVNPNLRALLEKLAKNKKSIYVFPSQTGSVQSPNTFSQKMARHMELLPISVQRVTPHELRHTYGTALRRHGVDIYTIQKIMGHRDIQMTANLYVHNEEQELVKMTNIGGSKNAKKA